MKNGPVRRVRVIINRKSGFWFRLDELLNSLRTIWDVPGIDLTYQESKDVKDGREKIRRAVEDGVDTVIVVGGDGMVNSIGAELVGTGVALAVLPTGSGNGFARHFDIPLNTDHAARLLKVGVRKKIDVGYANEKPFFITCGLAWDADLVKSFEESPVRGIVPYVFSGIHRYFTYEPQDFFINLDGKDIVIEKPWVLTIANLTQYGGGAKIAPQAEADDGQLTLVAVPKMEPLQLLPKIHRIFDGTITQIREIKTYNFTEMRVKRNRPDPIQMDGELIEAPEEFIVKVRPSSLDVMIP